MSSKSTYYELLGQHIQKFILDKWQTQKKAASMLGITANRVTEMINGSRPASQKTILKLQRYGFDVIHFERWYGIRDINPENLDKQEIIGLLADYKLLVRQQSEMINFLSNKIKSGN